LKFQADTNKKTEKEHKKDKFLNFLKKNNKKRKFYLHNKFYRNFSIKTLFLILKLNPIKQKIQNLVI